MLFPFMKFHHQSAGVRWELIEDFQVRFYLTIALSSIDEAYKTSSAVGILFAECTYTLAVKGLIPYSNGGLDRRRV